MDTSPWFILIGIPAPTDLALVTDVQVPHPRDRHGPGFRLTCEAALRTGSTKANYFSEHDGICRVL